MLIANAGISVGNKKPTPDFIAAAKIIDINVQGVIYSSERATEIFFGAEIEDLSDAQLLEIFADVPSGTISHDALSGGLPIVDALVTVGLAKSKSEGRRTSQQGGGYVNNRRIDENYSLTTTDLASESVVVTRTLPCNPRPTTGSARSTPFTVRSITCSADRISRPSGVIR